MRAAWQFLGKLEELEARLLAWGVVDGAFTPDEVMELAREFAATLPEYIEGEALVEELLDQRLLVRLRVHGRDLVRTRMAETVRLFARLRQLFPKRPWRAAPTLVADYRFALRPRRYPERNRPLSELLAELRAGGIAPTDVQGAALRALATHDGTLRDLAGFQLRAAARVWRDLHERRSRGMIVGAGTGTGKTLAFYLPALAHLAGLVRRDSFWTKAIALYPRNELLKDQFAETYAQARKLDRVLGGAGGRKLRIGAFFGPTPYSAAERHVERAWTREGDAYVCPFLRCPGCGKTLFWRRGELRAGLERLRCADAACGAVVQPDEVVLTRERMTREPPDVLFTTTEMLNLRITDAETRHVFGIGTDRPPRIVLLDEVHTYAGIHGAQVAYVLRRWRQAIGRVAVQFTGLSATLPNATEFFAQLVGLPAGAVAAVEPLPGDMEAEGMEYLLALRGDPASGTALLSTTIQSAMLLRRALDVTREQPSSRAAGTRVFVFADDLDVANRLYHNLLDAEGLTGGVRPRPRPGVEPLAALRAHRALPAHAETDPGERLAAGQSWYLAEQIGHALAPARALRVGRTTSQDAGVGQDLDVVVATASLEVGYNDPDVGAVIQHKAPYEVAAFLQRKGRAGRDRKMRPWTVVVLSDYGRDRAAYQAYDQLFDPSVETRTLPVGNRHVLRMQAAFAVMDWVAARAPRHLPTGSVWQDFSAPTHRDDPRRRRQGWEADLIRGVLDGSESLAQQSLEDYLAAALQVTSDEARALLWEPPRALMTSVLPTLLRRLEAQWGDRSPVGGAGKEPWRSSRPLPEFVPENLFSDLNLPEVVVETPPDRNGGPGEWPMPVLQAMRTLAPGRVTRRFAPFRARVSHWVPLPALAAGEQAIPVSDFCPQFEELGPVQVRDAAGVRQLPCYRPWTIRAAEVPREVSVTSNAFLSWRTQLSPSDEGERFEIPPGWESVLTEVRFFVHALHSHVQVRRFAVASNATIKLRSGAELDSRVSFVTPDGTGPACVGFVQESDGMVFCFRIPDGFRIGPDDPNGEKLRAFRAAYFRHRVMEDPVLSRHANVFARERLAQVYLSALTARALVDGKGLAAAATALRQEGLAAHLDRVLAIIFQTMSPDDGGMGVVLAETPDEGDDEAGEEDPRTENEKDGDEPQDLQRVARALRALAADERVVAALHQVAATLWAEPDEAWDAWAGERFKATLGGALLEACHRLCPQAGDGDFLLDLDAGPRPPDAPPPPDGMGEIWVTEATIGGGGLVEELLRRYAEDPRRFFLLARSALGPSDFEIVDAELTRILELLEADVDAGAAAAAARNAPTHQELQRAVDAFRETLASRGILTTHPVMSAVHARVFRPASSPASDAMLLDLVRSWRKAEADLGIDIDARVFAYVASATPHLDAALAHVGRAYLADPLWRFGTVYSLLWPRGGAVRARALSSYNPFASLPDADRAVLLDVLHGTEAHVPLGEPGWRERLTEALATRGAAHLYAAPDRHAELRAAVLEAVASPLDVEYLHLYPQVEGVERIRDRISVRLHVREVLP